MRKKKIMVLMDYIGESRNSTPYSRIKSLSEVFDVDIFLRKKQDIDYSDILISNYYKYSLFNIVGNIKRNQYDIIYTCGIHNYAIAYLAKIFSHGILVIDIFDDIVLGKNALKSKKGFFSNIKYAVFCIAFFIGKKVIKNADIVFLTLNKKILKYYPYRKNGYVHLINGIWSNILSKNKRNNLSANEFCSVTYVGYVQTDRGIFKILDAVNEINIKKKYKFMFNIVGPILAEDKSKIIEYLNLHEIDNVKLYGFTDYDKVLEILEKTNVALFIFPTGRRDLDYIYPIKIFEYLSYGLDIIATEGYGIEELKQIFNENINVVKYDSKIIADKLIEIICRGKKDRIIPKNLDDFTWEKINEKFISKINEAMRKKYAKR